MRSRRDFLKLAVGAVGGMVLMSCGGDGGENDQSPVIPNGYLFYRLINTGDPLPGGRRIASLPGASMISDVNSIIFMAIDDLGALGSYELLVDYAGTYPSVQKIRKIVRLGDTLPDGNVISGMKCGDMNRTGSFATALRMERGHSSAIYIDRQGFGLERVLGWMDKAPGMDGRIDHSIGDIDLHDNDDILCVAHYADKSTGRHGSGIFHLPNATNGTGAARVASSGDLLPNASGVIQGFGLLDRNDGDSYIASTAVTQGVSVGVGASGTPVRNTALISGSIKKSEASHLVSASADIRVAMRAGINGASSVTGESIMGARIGTRNDVAAVVHTSDDAMSLFYKNSKILSTADLSPNGNSIISFSPGVISKDGLLYFSTFGPKGVELCIASGSSTVSILASGHSMPNDKGQVIDRFIFGAMPEQVDSKGRITFVGDYNLATAPLSAVVIGIPV